MPITAVNDEKSFLIEQLSNFIDQQARRRFHQQFQQHHAGKQHGPIPQEISGPGFSFVLPGNSPNGFLSENDPITFAVSPNDPRYYQSTPKEEYGKLRIKNMGQTNNVLYFLQFKKLSMMIQVKKMKLLKNLEI